MPNNFGARELRSNVKLILFVTLILLTALALVNAAPVAVISTKPRSGSRLFGSRMTNSNSIPQENGRALKQFKLKRGDPEPFGGRKKGLRRGDYGDLEQRNVDNWVPAYPKPSPWYTPPAYPYEGNNYLDASNGR
ncbi:hypothetical protein VKT23_013473 [Stygiomarasmius scandens]|uniref:Uncharacterized protein n=1 Tax=Marasmiellus scandens TaxID=2682957 RepID=A0ABR1J3W8_9AGAR